MNKFTLVFAVIFCGVTAFAVGFDYRNPYGFSSAPKVESKENVRSPSKHQFAASVIHRQRNAIFSSRSIRNSSRYNTGGRGFHSGK